MNFLREIVYSLTQWLDRVAAGAVIAMMLLVGIHVLLRSFGWPIWGSFELVGFLNIIVVACAIAFTAVKRGHIAIELVVSNLPQRAQAIIDSITCFSSLCIFSLAVWQNIEYAGDLRRSGEVSATLEVPFFSLVYLIAFCLAVLCLALLIDLINSLAKVIKK